jgi:hypothetical protein
MRLTLAILLCLCIVSLPQAQTTSVGSENLPEIRLENPEKVDQIIQKVLPRQVFDQLMPGTRMLVKFELSKKGKVQSLYFMPLPSKLQARDASQTIADKYLKKLGTCLRKNLRFSIDEAYKNDRQISMSFVVKGRQNK